VLVLGTTGVAPVEQVHVEALTQEILDEAVAGHQVQYVGAKDGCVDDQERYRVHLLAGRLAVIEPRLALPPDLFLGGGRPI
jgi:hypothetical protein